MNIARALTSPTSRSGLLVAATILVIMSFASTAAAQAGLTDPVTEDPPPVPASPTPTPNVVEEPLPDQPSPTLTPPPDSGEDPPAVSASPTPTSTPEGDEEPAPETDEDTEKREDAVPDADEEASSDRIQFRDPLDFDQEPVKVKWDNFVSGLRGITQYSFFDNQLRFRLGGRFQIDGTLVSVSDQLQDTIGDQPNSVRARRARIFAEGIFRKMYFRVEFDFAADAGFKSFYLEGKEGGLEIWGHLLGKFRYGYFQEPFSLEQNLSSFDTTFAEVSLPVSTIVPGNNLGAMVYDASKNRRFTWAFGAFSWGSGGADNASTSSLSLTGRFGFQPVLRNDGSHTFHFGLSLSTRTPTGDAVRYEARPEARFIDPFADTQDIPSARNNLIGLEAAWKRHSNWAQLEFIRSNVSSSEAGDPHFSGFSFQIGRFLTGQSRPWDNLVGVWGRVRPEQRYRGGNPFKKKNGGAWEVAARYSAVDLTDGNVYGGTVRNITAGVNWYVSTVSKFQFNWVHSRREDSGYANIWILRYQYAIK